MPARRRPTSSIRAKPPAQPSYDESLARRVRHLLARKPGVVEKRMFGGLAFLVNSNMCVGIWKDSLIARLGPEQAAVALRQPGASEFDVTGRPMRGWVMIDAAQLADDVELDDWIGQCLRFVRSLPAK